MKTGELPPKWADQIVPRDIALATVNRTLLGRWQDRRKCARHARAKPLPGPAGDAFLRGSLQVGPHSVSKVMAVHQAALQALNSPVLKLVELAADQPGAQKEAKWDFAQQEIWDACYVFTQSPETIFDLFEAGRLAEIQKLARREVGLTWAAAEVNLVFLTVLEQFSRHAATTVEFVAGMKEDGIKTFFLEATEPKTPTG